MTETTGPGFPPLRYGLLHGLVGHLLRHSYNRAYAAFEAAFQDDGITPLQFMIFELVQHNPGVTHADIARAMGTSASVVTTTMKPMLADRWIRRRPLAGDSRQRVYEATAEGVEWFARIRPKIQRSEDQLADSLGPEQRAELLRLLRLLLGIGSERGG